MKPIRLHKYMAISGIASRRQCESIINMGRVSVNGKVISAQGLSVIPGKDHVRVDGKLLQPKASGQMFYLFHKPRNVITTMSDPQGRPTIADYFPPNLGSRRIFPVGRLDFDVSGCLLLTDDGELAHRLMHPKYSIARIYEVKVRGNPPAKTLGRIRKLAGKCTLTLIKSEFDKSWWRFTLFEGKYHQVKRLWQMVGHPVIKMRRLAYGGISIQNLASGQMRRLRPQETELLMKQVALK